MSSVLKKADKHNISLSLALEGKLWDIFCEFLAFLSCCLRNRLKLDSRYIEGRYKVCVTP